MRIAMQAVRCGIRVRRQDPNIIAHMHMSLCNAPAVRNQRINATLGPGIQIRVVLRIGVQNVEARSVTVFKHATRHACAKGRRHA